MNKSDKPNIKKEENRLVFDDQGKSIGTFKFYYEAITQILGLPITPVLLAGQSIYHLTLHTKRLLLGNNLRPQIIKEVKEKIIGFKSSVHTIKETYATNKDKLLELSGEGYDMMQRDIPELLQEYMAYYGLHNKEEYIAFVNKSIDQGINIIEERSHLADRINTKHIPDSGKAYMFILNMFLGGFMRTGKESYFLSRIGRDVKDIQSNTLHEGEHFMQNALAGSLLKEGAGKEIIWYCSPIYYNIFKKMLGVFKGVSIDIKSEKEEVHKNYLIAGIKTVKELYEKLLLDIGLKNYYSDCWEILARIREIKGFLKIGKRKISRDNFLGQVIDFKPRLAIKDFVIDIDAFIDFMNEIP